MTCFAVPETLEHTATIRNVMKGCLDDYVIQRCEAKLQSARNVKEFFQVLENQKEIF